MTARILIAGLAGVLLAGTAGAQVAPTATTQGTVGTKASSNKAVSLKTKVDASVASTAKVSADSAYAIARARADNGEVSSATLEHKDGRLIYEVKVLNKSKRATEVKIDALTGQVLEDKKYGGAKATAVHHKENKKLLNAKRDSAAKTP